MLEAGLQKMKKKYAGSPGANTAVSVKEQMLFVACVSFCESKKVTNLAQIQGIKKYSCAF